MNVGAQPVGVVHAGAGLVRSVELSAQRGEGAAQLVRGVGKELALPGACRLEPIEHGIHRAGQPGDLVVAGRLGHPPVECRCRDVLDLSPDRLHRTQGPSGEQPGRGGDQGDNGGNAEAKGRAERRHAVADVL